jgi:hypothetical protein
MRLMRWTPLDYFLLAFRRSMILVANLPIRPLHLQTTNLEGRGPELALLLPDSSHIQN